MSGLPTIYGLDLTIDASGPFVDPASDRVLEVGLSASHCDDLFAGDEADLLRELDDRLAMLPAGIIVTWHGSVLAIPLIAARARLHRLTLGLALEQDKRSAPPSPILGLDAAVRARWGQHAVLDLQRVYEPGGGRWWGRRHRDHRDRDHEALFPPTDDLIPRDPCKDARLVRCLAERRWSQAKRHIDALSQPVAPSGTAPQAARLV